MVAALTCPIRKQEWALNNDCFGYRSSRHIGALNPRDGEWYSRCDSALLGDLFLHCRQGSDLPDSIHARIRASW